MNMIIRTAKESDAEELLNIYTPYVTDTAITFEYDVPSTEEFRRRIANTLTKYPYLVAEEGGKILGYAYAGTFKGRAAYDWSVESSIYVDRALRRTGVGGKLYRVLENVLREMGIYNVNACIGYASTEDEHLTNNSVEFHEHIGYRMVGKFTNSGYKFGTWYDMVWMEKILAEHPQVPSKVIPYVDLTEDAKVRSGITIDS